MATAVVTLVTVHSSDLFKTGHMANRWFGGISRQLGTAVRAAAPLRTGELKRGIHTSMKAVPAAHEMTIDLTSSSPHTMYVLRGTHYPIRSTDNPGGDPEGKKMGPLPPWGAHTTQYLVTARGQTANNFLLKGWSVVSARHRSMGTPGFVRNP